MRKLLLVVCAIAAVPRVARADTLACQTADADSVTVDGMLDDWEGVDKARAGGKDKDESFDLRCVVEGDALALSVDVRDDHLVRLYKAKGKKQEGEDHLVVKVGTVELHLWPGTEHQPPRRTFGKKQKKLPKWVAVEDTQQPKGWSMEIRVPVAKLGGDGDEVDGSVSFLDADDTEVHTSEALDKSVTLSLGGEAPSTTSGGGGGVDLFDKFLKDAHLKKKDVKIDEKVGGQRIVVGGTVIGVIGKSYTFVTLPVDTAADVQKVQLVDLRGDGTKQVLAVLRQSSDAGSRDLIAVFGVDGGPIDMLFSVEIRKQIDTHILESTWKLRARKGKKGQELVVEAGEATDWDEDTFEVEPPPDDAEPIHLPWDDSRHGGVYWLDGTTLRSKVLKNTH